METLELALCPKEEKHDEDVTKLLEDGVQAMQDDNHLVVARFYSLHLVSARATLTSIRAINTYSHQTLRFPPFLPGQVLLRLLQGSKHTLWVK